MALLLDLLAFPVMGPVKGLMWIAEKISEHAESEVYDESKLRGRLMELELRYDLQEISTEEYEQAEAALLKLLRVSRERQREEL